MGRVYPNFGLTSIRRKVRNTLVRDLYYDFDIKKCQQSILLILCKKLNIHSPCLEDYVNNENNVVIKSNNPHYIAQIRVI